MTPDDVAEAICSYAYNHDSEFELQEGIESVLRLLDFPAEREVALSGRDRVDFLVEGRIGVEVKTKGSLAQLTRQVHRYVQHARIDAVVVVTTRASHAGLPPMMGGKPVVVAHLIGDAL